MTTPLNSRNSMIVVGLESTYGVDVEPSIADGTTAAILSRDISINPAEGASVDLNYIRPYFGASKSLRASYYMTVQLTTDWMPNIDAGIGDASPLDPLFQACGLKVVGDTAITNLTTHATFAGFNPPDTDRQAQTGSTPNTIVLAASGESAVNDYYNGAIIRLNNGPLGGQSRVITAYNGTTKTATLNRPWTPVTTSPPGVTPIVTVSAPGAGTKYRVRPFARLASTNASAINGIYNGKGITVADAGAVRAISYYDATHKTITITSNWETVPAVGKAVTINAARYYEGASTEHKSATIYYFSNSVLHKIVGCRGTFTIDLSANALPSVTFNFTGLYGGIVDGTLPTPSYAKFGEPLPINADNTTGALFGKPFTGGNSGLQMSKLTFDLGNTVTHRQLVGYEQVLITNRESKGSITIDMTSLEFMDWNALLRSSSSGELYLENGSAYGQTVSLSMPAIQLDSLSYGNADDIITLDLNYRALPVIGNDDFRLIEK